MAEAEKRLAAALSPPDVQRVEDLQRRFEMAVDNVRQLKRRNTEIEEELAAYQAGAGRPSAAAGGPTQDWESTKKRMLAELNDDEDHKHGPALSGDERLTVEGAIRITDEMVIQRDREIVELKQQLEKFGNRTDDTAQVLDQDTIIQQERQRLLALQQEWQEKMRQAEVDISVQRARIARERSDVEEKLRVLESEKESLAAQRASGEPSSPDKPSKPARRWLARLGLKENDKE